MESAAPNPTDIPAPGSYRWTPALQREFLDQLAINGSVKIASAMVCMSPGAAYQLKQRPEGAAFRLGWSAAILIARGRLADELLDRAIWGVEETSERDATGHPAALGCWLAARDNRANPLAALWKDTSIANEVAQFSADIEEEPEADPTPEEEAAAMTMWRDEETSEWRTNFPPPDDFIGIEEGEFGDPDYERTLDADEEAAWEATCAAATAPLRKAGEAARRAFFGLPVAANDPTAEPASKPRNTAHG